MGTKAALKAKLRFTMPYIISPQRATRRFRFFMDSTMNLSDPGHLTNRLKSCVEKNGEISEDPEEIVRGFEKFQKQITALMIRDENAEWGAIYELKEEEERIKKGITAIKGRITKDKNQAEKKLGNLKTLNNINNKFYEEISREIDEEVVRIKKIFLPTLDTLQKKELLISRERDQMIEYLLKTSSGIKSELNANPFKIKADDKDRDRFLEKIMKDIKRKDKPAVESDLKELLKIITDSVKLVFDEIADLIEILLNILKSLDSVYKEYVTGKLARRMNMPKKYLDRISVILAKAIEDIRTEAEIDFEAIKIEMQEVNSIR